MCVVEDRSIFVGLSWLSFRLSWQCRRKPEWPPPELQQLALNSLAMFFSRRCLLNNDHLLVVTVYEVYLCGTFT